MGGLLYAFCQADSFIEKVSLRMFERVVKGRVRGGEGGCVVRRSVGGCIRG